MHPEFPYVFSIVSESHYRVLSFAAPFLFSDPQKPSPCLSRGLGDVYKRQVKRETGKEWAFADPKTKRGRRTIKLGNEILKLLRTHKENQDAQKSIMGSRWKENGLVFPSLAGTPSNPSNLRKEFLKVLDRAGLPRIRFHDLRHTAASLMLSNGIPLNVVSNRLGHSQPSTTLDIYAHLFSETQADAAKIMDDLVTPIKLDMREFGNQKVIQGENEMDIPE